MVIADGVIQQNRQTYQGVKERKKEINKITGESEIIQFGHANARHDENNVCHAVAKVGLG